MANDSDILRSLRDIQRSVPDRDFFVHNKLLGEVDKDKKKKSGLFSGTSFLGGKKRGRIDIEHAREQVKAFHNSFLAVRRTGGDDGKNTGDPGTMTIAAMNEYRSKIREAAETEDADASHLALDAIVKFIDLKNSGMMADKQPILQDCLKKIGYVLHTDGGISLFHTTWFLTIYREYLGRFKMFPRGEYAQAQREGSAEAQAIAKRLHHKQFEIPHYLQLVDEKAREVRLLIQYSNEEAVKRSPHGQRGCTWEEMKRIFHERCQNENPSAKPNQLNEVSLLIGYALLFARIPMLTQVVELMRNLIPAVNLEGILYRQKIVIAQKINLLEIARGMYQNDGSAEYQKKLFLLAESVYKYCVRVIADNNLERIQTKSEIYAHPILKQAVILITYKNIFRTQLEAYVGALKKSKELLQTVKSCANSGQKALQQLAENAAVYDKNLDNILLQVKSESAAGYEQSDFGESHENW